LEPKLPHPDAAEEYDSIEIREIIALILRRRWIALTVVLSILTGGIIYSIRAPRIYRGTSVVLINQRTPEFLGREVQGFSNSDNYTWLEQKNYYETQYKVILSRPVADLTLKTLQIQPDLLISALQSETESLENVLLQDPLRGLPGNLTNQLKLLGFTHRSREELIESLTDFDSVKFLKALAHLEPVKDSQLVNIHVEHQNPEFAARIANAIADSYVDNNLQERVNTTRSAVDWLSDSVLELKARLNTSEQALQAFKADNKIISVSLKDRQSMTSQTLTELNTRLSATRAELIALESHRKELNKALKRGSGTVTLQEVVGNHHIQTLKSKIAAAEQLNAELTTRYTDEHPKVIAAKRKLGTLYGGLRQEIKLVRDTFEHNYQAMLSTEKGLQNLFSSVKTTALELNRKELEYKRLERDAKKNLDVYSLVLKRQKEAQLSQMLKVNNIRKLEPAVVPLVPISPRLQFVMLLSLLLAFVSGVGSAFIADFIDNTIKTQHHIESTLGLPFLGIIPSISSQEDIKSPRDRDQYIVANPRSSVAECCRTIRTNLMFMTPDAPAKSLLVTSSNPKEGKSTTAVNLAITMAQSGAKTILIDTDMRRPRIHKSFEISSEYGVTNVILGDRTADELVTPSGIENLDLLPCGPIPPNPAELLHTARFKDLLVWLNDHYDRIIFDTPPVSAVADALILSSMTDGVIFVTQATQTPIPNAKFAKKRLLDVGGNIMGVVLNDVDLENKTYGSDYYQYYYYRSGYYGEKDLPVAEA